ncbi:C1 family peptidase [Flavihumibacter sediminis]|nr:C1 family peptidase [Flavihumibacter sediminis]
MRKIQLKSLAGISLIIVGSLSSCQKEISDQQEAISEGPSTERSLGAIFDDAAEIMKVKAVVSADYAAGKFNSFTTGDAVLGAKGGGTGAKGGKPRPAADADADGIADANDACPTQKETFNGYQDTDGCPDTAPVPTDPEVLPPPPTTIPASFIMPAPPVANQGSESTCVTFAAVYNARSIEQYYKTGATSFSLASNIFSPEFVYNQTKVSSSCASGSAVITTLNFLVNKGSCTWNTMPYSTSNGCTTLPTSTQTAEAANYRISSYVRVLASDRTAMKQMLAAKHPLIMTFTADANFYNYKPGTIWNSYSTTFYGPHAMTIVGYDDAKQAYKAVNQWGTTWGDAGYIWIAYDFLPSISYDLYSIKL